MFVVFIYTYIYMCVQTYMHHIIRATPFIFYSVVSLSLSLVLTCSLYFAQARIPHDDTVWFLATDSEQIRKAVLSRPYKHKMLFFEGPVRHLDFEFQGCDESNHLKL